MAVFDALWWGVWWPWMLVWGVTLVSMVVAVTITITHRRRHHRTAAQQIRGSAFYLDDDFVMDLYRLYGGKYKAALHQEVEEKISNSREAGVFAELAPVRAGGRRGVNSEVLRRYIENAEPIAVIGIIIDVLDKADDIIDVDLRKREVTSNRALDKVVDIEDDERPNAVRLRGVDAFVSVRGRFRQAEQTASTTTFLAPYGDPTDPAAGPQVHVTCAASGLRGAAVPTGSFPARCLGRVEDWDPEGRRLVLHPMAIFR